MLLLMSQFLMSRDSLCGHKATSFGIIINEFNLIDNLINHLKINNEIILKVSW